MGVSTLDRGRGTLGVPPESATSRGKGYLPWTGGGVPTLGYPLPPGVNRQTPVKTVPSRRTTYAGGNNKPTRTVTEV